MKNIHESKFNGIINLGDHLVLLYRDSEDITETVVSYITHCLKTNVKCIYINGDTDSKAIQHRLIDLNMYKSYVENNQLLFINKEDAYSKNGKFEPEKMKDLLKSLALEAVDQGFDGIGISGEISWVLDYKGGFELIFEYEWKINSEVFSDYPVTALCRYNMDKFSDDMIVNVIQLHPYLIINNKVHENPFYIPAIAYKENNVKKYQVQTMLENIVNFTNTKSDFNQRIVEKDAAYDILKDTITNDIIHTIIGLLELHNKYTNNHSEHVAEQAKKLAKKLGLSKKTQAIVYYTSLVHDIGKIKVSPEILDKPGKLTDEEYTIIKKHPEWGEIALKRSSKLKEISKFVRHHHERYDGKGYPDQLIGDSIPFVSRIISVCDAYDAMTSERPYRNPFTKEEAISELIRCKGSQFDPLIVDVFIEQVVNE